MQLKRVLSKLAHPGRPRRTSSPAEQPSTDSPSDSRGEQPSRRSIGDFIFDKFERRNHGDASKDDNHQNNNHQNNEHRKRDSRLTSHTKIKERRTSKNRARLSDMTLTKQRLDKAREEDSEESRALYGDLPLIQSSQSDVNEKYVRIDDITDNMIGKEVEFIARVHNMRKMASRFAIIILRQQVSTIQAIIRVDEGSNVSQAMVRWAEHIETESIVKVKGVLVKPPNPVIQTSFHNMELKIHSLHVIQRRHRLLPFSIYEADLAKSNMNDNRAVERKSVVPDRTRLTNRVIDLRTQTAQSVFRVQSGICNSFRTALNSRDFTEIHTPKLQGSATESGASVFKIEYFGRSAFLAQSPQLAKQMAIIADFGRVYEIGAVFRAENSNTHRHLTEYTGLDIEMTIDQHYHEMMHTLDFTLKEIFKNVYQQHRREVEIVKEQFPHQDLVWLEKTPVIHYADGIKLLNESGWVDEQGEQLVDTEDLGTRDEIRLGELVKEKYNTDYYILDKFPAAVRPFYTMPSPEDPRFSNSFDVFVRGQEIISGGQRIHDPKLLEDRMLEMGVAPESLDEYTTSFAYGAPPHAGAGVGLERLVMLILQLGNIRHACLFHRDPRSFMNQSPPTWRLRHPKSSTIHPPWKREKYESSHQIDSDSSSSDEELGDKSLATVPEKRRNPKVLQPLDELVANYGDATATSFMDPKFSIWRDNETGAAVAYCPSESHVLVTGDPLCDPTQFGQIIGRFLPWLDETIKLKPIWILCSEPVQEILGAQRNWRTLSCIADERIDLKFNRSDLDKEVDRKVRHAKKEGVKIHHLSSDTPFPGDIQAKIDQRIEDWKKGRENSKQVHLSSIEPWIDQRHRTYYYAVDGEGTICAFVVLATIAPRYGQQMKYALDFPNAPSGAIEYIMLHAVQSMAASGVKNLTFGAGATPTVIRGYNLKGTKVTFLTRLYDSYMSNYQLKRKSEFRQKMGAEGVPLYVAYPKHGLGSKGVSVIMDFFT